MQHLFEIMDQYPAIPICIGVAFLIIVLMSRKGRRKPKPKTAGGLLDQALFWWTDRDSFRVRDLLNGGALILGRAGSGKTSSSGRTLMQAIVDNPKSGGLIPAAKPEDEADVRRIFRKAGRLDDLIVFGPDNGWRFNFLDYVGKGQTRNVVQCLMMIGETLKRGEGKGKDDSQFWETLNERFLYNTVAALKAAGEPVTADRILRFLMSAPTSAEEQRSEAWQALYHNKVMERAAGRQKTLLEAHDFQLCMEFWVKEYPVMDAKTRSNGLAGVMNILHTFNTGLVREMVSGESNCSPDDILAGKWVLVNFPPSVWGEVGSFICAGWKYLTELAILKRKADEDSPFCVIWADEAHQFVNAFDSSFIAQCRSHKGCLAYLTQSVSSFYAAMKGDAGRHQADALLANFSNVIIHASDPVTAKWASAKLGRRKEILYSGSSSQGHETTVWDQLYGNQHVTGSFSETYEQVLQDQEWMTGRTGGPNNDYLADAIVIRSGEPFADGMSYKRVVFSQR